jgi:protein-S-isoprenylcysteine O-methyltransferase Ste14
MNVWLAKGVILAAMAAMLAIRAPHGRRSRGTEVASTRKGTLERVLLTLASLGCFVPLAWIVSPAFAFADYSLHPIPFLAGGLCLVVSLWLFHRSHTDLGTNWSPTLELRAGHRLITHGVYRHIRHPMYASLLLYSIGQTLAVPNWIVGPSFLTAFACLFAFRVAAEERMMRDQFGDDYARYMRQTRRLVPGVW